MVVVVVVAGFVAAVAEVVVAVAGGRAGERLSCSSRCALAGVRGKAPAAVAAARSKGAHEVRLEQWQRQGRWRAGRHVGQGFRVALCLQLLTGLTGEWSPVDMVGVRMQRFGRSSLCAADSSVAGWRGRRRSQAHANWPAAPCLPHAWACWALPPHPTQKALVAALSFQAAPMPVSADGPLLKAQALHGMACAQADLPAYSPKTRTHASWPLAGTHGDPGNQNARAAAAAVPCGACAALGAASTHKGSSVRAALSLPSPA